MDASVIVDTLSKQLPGTSFEVAPSVDYAAIYVPGDRLVDTCRALLAAPSLRFNVLLDVTAADYFPRDPRFEVVYHLLSVANRQRLRLKVRVGAGGTLPTLQGVWRGAGWPEREVWDMFGIVFEGHSDLRRLLMPDDWEGHPLRKDYPVQLRKVTQTYQPLEVSEEEFRANIERDRVRRTQ